MNNSKRIPLCLALIVLSTMAMDALSADKDSTLNSSQIRPALSITVIKPRQEEVPVSLSANGSIAAWQEAVIGAEVSDLRLKSIRAEVGDRVRKGQILAEFTDDTVMADIAQSKALLNEAEALLTEARMNADRARKAAGSSVFSAQQVSQYLTSEKTAAARVSSAKAQLDQQLLRQRKTRVQASDDGVISARTATLGAVATPGQELFRLIRQHRLEWRAEVTAAEMAQLSTQLKVKVQVPNVATLEGYIRSLAPTLDAQSRNGLVYVDLPDAARKGFRPGMFAQGEFFLGNSTALTIPQEAVSLRDGFSYVFRLGNESQGQAVVTQVKVQLGRRIGERFEVLSGIGPEDRLVASGAAFLTDADTVRVVSP